MKMKKHSSGLLLVLLFACSPLFADVYKWTDEQGRVHYGDKPIAGAKQEKVDITINSYESVTIKSFSSSAAQKTEKVIMYSTAWCGYCKKARRYFESNNIPYVEYDIEKNKRAKYEYDKLGGKGVPVILLGKKRMNGFSQSSFERMYGS